MAALFKHIDTQKIKKTLVYLLAFLMIGLNQLQSYQFKYRIIHHDSMSRQAYWAVFCKLPRLDEETKYKVGKMLIKPNGKQVKRTEKIQTIW
jgi:hypothetical protein